MDHGIPAVSIRSTTIKQTDQRYIPTFLKNTSCIFTMSQMKLYGRQHKVQVGGGIGGMCPQQIILKIESPLFSQWFILSLLLYSSIANPQTMSFFIDVDGSRVMLF